MNCLKLLENFKLVKSLNMVFPLKALLLLVPF